MSSGATDPQLKSARSSPPPPHPPLSLPFPHLLQRLRTASREVLPGVFHEEQQAAVETYLAETVPGGKRRYAKAGGYERGMVVNLGRVTFRVQRLMDRTTGQTFAPFAQVPSLAHRTIAPDVRRAIAEDAAETSFRRASRSFERHACVRVSRQSAHNFLQELAGVVEEEHRADPPDAVGKTHLMDSTEVRGKRKGKGDDHAVHVALVQDPTTHRCEVVNVAVDTKPRDVLPGPVERLTTDLDPSLAMVPARRHQGCHRHLVGDLHFLLWKRVWRKKGDGQKRAAPLDRTRRQGWVKELARALAILRASVEKHRKDGRLKRLRWRIQQTLRTMAGLAQTMARAGYRGAAKFLGKHARGAVVFAEAALEGEEMPATSNGAERQMGTVANRCKGWGRWGSGLRPLVLLLLVMRTRPVVYARASAAYLRRG